MEKLPQSCYLAAFLRAAQMMHTAGMRFSHLPPTSITFLLGIAGIGCGPDPATSSIWVARDAATGGALTELSSEAFFDHPWPSDLRLENGKVKLTNFPNPRLSGNISAYITHMDGVLDGFSPAAAGFLRFTRPISTESLPTPKLSLNFDAAVQLINIDSGSPECGLRTPVSLKFRKEAGVYYPENTLAFMPSPGFPLRPRTRYALVVTDDLSDADGYSIEKSQALAEVLGEEPASDPATKAASVALEPAVRELEKAGIDRDDIVHLAVFTTNDPTEELFAVRDHLRANVQAPNVDTTKWRLVATSDYSAEYVGEYGPSPNYQRGNLPFASPKDGGDFNFVNGAPTTVDMFNVRFSLSIPTSDECPIPTNGYPIALYAHGTGGNFRSYVRDGSARSLARRCVASMGVDQIFHGTRPGAPPADDDNATALRFFNVDNVLAARTSNRQSALDEVQRARLFTETHIQIPANISVWGQAISFDSSHVMFFGHSQGGLNGPLFLAADDQALGGVLSGSGAIMSITLTEKTEPSPSVAGIVKSVMLGLRTEEFGEVDVFHPALSFAQMLVDVTDPIHYARRIITEPRQGMKPKSIYMTVGVDSNGNGDSYSPPRGIEMHAVAMGLPLISNGRQLDIPEMEWPGGPGIITLPTAQQGSPPPGIERNLANKKATGALAQWAPAVGSDGHFVVFDINGARSQADSFISTLGYNDFAELLNTQ